MPANAAEAISVVVITRDRAESTLRSVRRLRSLPEAPQVIVVDNDSSDDTVARLGGIDGVRVLPLPENLAAAGRNVGVSVATTPYVAFADDDSWWDPGALTRAVELFDRHPRLALLAGRVLVGSASREDPLNEQLARSPLGTEPGLPGPTILGFLACGAIVRRAAFLEVGGFHRRYGVGGEEELLALDLAAAGWQLCYVHDLVAHHHPAGGAVRPGRVARQRRNELWTAMLRRPLAVAGRRALSVVRDARHDPAARQVLRESVTALPWIAAERRPVPAGVEQLVGRLERDR
jgi:GT2 family glycosyltransferase